MPFAAERRHQYWSVDVRYLDDHQLGTGKPLNAISILENFSRAFLASAISPRQDLTAYLIVLRAAVEAHGAPEVLVSDVLSSAYGIRVDVDVDERGCITTCPIGRYNTRQRGERLVVA